MIRRLYVLYDSRCGVCSKLRSWVHVQQSLVEFEFVPAGSDRARQLFPALRNEVEPSELVVVSNEGGVFTGNDAWILCLWGLRAYRELSYRLARGPLRPFARAAWSLLSSNRRGLSAILSFRSDEELARELGAEAQSCDLA